MTQQDNRAAGLFIDNGYHGHFEFSRPEEYRFIFDGGQYTEYIFAGPTMREILEGYTWLTGRMLPPPLWALGYHQCRCSSTIRTPSSGSPHGCARGIYRATCCGSTSATWTATACSPGTQSLPRRARHARALEKREAFGWSPSSTRGVKPTRQPGVRRGRRARLFCKTEGQRYLHRPGLAGQHRLSGLREAGGADVVGRAQRRPRGSGLAGIWNDMNEPATGAIAPQAMRFEHGQHHARALPQPVCPPHGHGHHEGLRAAEPEPRTFILRRAGFAGIQRYAAQVAGRQPAPVGPPEISMPMAMGLGLSGQPFVGADVPGFSATPTPELAARWMQYGALTRFAATTTRRARRRPVPLVVRSRRRKAQPRRARASLPFLAVHLQRLHAGQRDRLSHSAPARCSTFRTIARLARRTTSTCSATRSSSLRCFQPGQTARHVYLPEGTWIDWYTGERHTGGQFITAAAPLDRIPLFARGGHVIPSYVTAPQSTMGHQPEVVELHIVAPQEGGEFVSVLHEDDGLTFGFKEGAFYRTTFTLRRESARLTLLASVSGNGYPEFARDTFEVRLHGATSANVRVDGKEMAAQDGRSMLQNTGSGFELEADLA